MSVLMEVSILVGEDRGWEFRRIGGRSGTGGDSEERVGGGSSNMVGSGKNRGKLCNNASYFAIKERG